MMTEARRHWLRRRLIELPIRNRWQVVKYRSRVTWGQWWVDVLYLVRG